MDELPTCPVVVRVVTGKPRHVRAKLLALAISTLSNLSRKYAGRCVTGPGDQDSSSYVVTFLLAAARNLDYV